MTYLGRAPDPPRTFELWEAVPGRLATPLMEEILGGPGRIRLVTDPMEPEGTEEEAWGRIVVAPVRRLYGELAEQPGRRRTLPFLVRAEVHHPGGAYQPAFALEAAHSEAFALLHGWKPDGFTYARVVTPIWRETTPEPLPSWDEATGLWYLGAEYRAVLAPA